MGYAQTGSALIELFIVNQNVFDGKEKKLFSVCFHGASFELVVAMQCAVVLGGFPVKSGNYQWFVKVLVAFVVFSGRF